MELAHLLATPFSLQQQLTQEIIVFTLVPLPKFYYMMALAYQAVIHLMF